MPEQVKPSIVHRDLKSANVMIREDLSLAVGDFGVALALDDAQDFSNMDTLKAEVLQSILKTLANI